jgi:hypothetical protein
MKSPLTFKIRLALMLAWAWISRPFRIARTWLRYRKNVFECQACGWSGSWWAMQKHDVCVGDTGALDEQGRPIHSRGNRRRASRALRSSRTRVVR